MHFDGPLPGSYTGSHIAAQERGVLELGSVGPTHDEAIAAGRTITDLDIKKDSGAPDESFTALNADELKKYLGARDYQNSGGIVQPAVCIHDVKHGVLIATAHKGRVILYCSHCGYKEFPTTEMYDGRLARIRESLTGLLSESSLKLVMKEDKKEITLQDLTQHFLALLKKAE